MNFLNYKIIGAPKKFKNQPRPLVRSSSLKFSQNFWNPSLETVPLKKKLNSRVIQKIGCGIEIKAQWIIQSAARRNMKVKVQDVLISGYKGK